MYSKQSKKALPLIILEILQKYSDENHRLSQREIEKYLSDKYDMDVDRRSVKRGITDLIDLGLNIQYTEYIRKVLDKQSGTTDEQVMLTDFYLERDFCDCEIRLLIDEILDTKYIPSRQRKQLISKLEGLTSIYFRKGYDCSKRMDEDEERDNQLFFSIDVLEEAIASSSKVSFLYKTSYAGNNGGIETKKIGYTVLPEDICVENGKYILHCTTENGEWHIFKLDNILNIKIDDVRSTFNRAKKIIDKCTVVFETKEKDLELFIEEFGEGRIRVGVNDEMVRVKVNTMEDVAINFALKNLDKVVLVSPILFQERIRSFIENGLLKY